MKTKVYEKIDEEGKKIIYYDPFRQFIEEELEEKEE